MAMIRSGSYEYMERVAREELPEWMVRMDARLVMVSRQLDALKKRFAEPRGLARQLDVLNQKLRSIEKRVEDLQQHLVGL